MTTLALTGCRAAPLGSYLKALGVLRIIGAQADPAARGAWHGDRFHLLTSLTPDDLVDHFQDRYRPTPVVSPWNGGSGFGPKDQQQGIAAIEATLDDRFAEYRAAVTVGRRLAAEPTWGHGAKAAKARQVAWCRAELPDAALAWVDATVVLTDDRAVFPPLFGTGGNDGRLDFSNNFMQRLTELLLQPPKRGATDPRHWLRAALFGGDTGPLIDASAGQYEPAVVEAAAVATSGRGTRLTNPWDYVLVIEGGLAFASACSRRLGRTGTSARAAMPFCVDASSVGHATSTDGEESRGEVWAPLWRRPASADEVSRMIGEGRVRWDGRTATTGVDFAKAVATLGVDRGIDRFVRHGLVQRFGLTYLAVPLGEVAVAARPEVDVLRQVDGWLEGLPGRLPAEATAARRRVEVAEFRTTVQAGGHRAADLQDVLVSVFDLEVAIGRSRQRGEVASPVGARRPLSATDWLPLLDDGTVELRLATTLASGRDRLGPIPLARGDRTASSLALLLRPIALDAGARMAWGSAAAQVEGAGRRPALDVLAEALVRRALVAEAPRSIHGDARSSGVLSSFDIGMSVSLSDLADLAAGRVDLVRLDRLLRALILLDWRRRDGVSVPPPARRATAPRRVTPALAVLLPFFHPAPFVARGPEGALVEVALRPERSWPALLAADRGDEVLRQALHRLRTSGFRPAPRVVRRTSHETGPLLAAACLCRVSAPDARRLVEATCPPPDDRHLTDGSPGPEEAPT